MSKFSMMVMEKTLDGDIQTTIADVPYSTSPREVVCIEDMEYYAKRKEEEEENEDC